MSFVVKYDHSTGQVLGIHPSAHTPLYANRPGYLINPDRSAVKDVSRSRWHVENGRLVVGPEPSPVPAIQTRADPGLIDAFERLEGSNSDMVQLTESLRSVERGAPTLSGTLVSVIEGTVFSLVPGTGGIPAFWRGPCEVRRIANLGSLLGTIVRCLQDVHHRVDDLASSAGVELVKRIAEAAAKATDEHELHAARQAFRQLSINGVTAESSELTQAILELRSLHIQILCHIDMWTDREHPGDQLVPQHIAMSLGIDTALADAGIARLVGAGLLHGMQSGPAAPFAQVSLSHFGAKVVDIMARPEPSCAGRAPEQ